MKQSNVVTGIVLTVLAGIVFASMDGLGKQLTGVISVLQIVWGRYLFQTLIVSVILARRTGTGFLRTRRPGLQLLRGATLLCATFLMYSAIAVVPLADATAAMFVSPILVTIFSVIFLGERIGIHRIAAILCGFLGVVLIVRPGTSAMQPAILLALAAAVFNAAYFLLTRRLAGVDDAVSTHFNTTAVGVVILTLLVIPLWETPSPVTFALLVAMGAIGTLGHAMIVRAFAEAPASLLSPFLYGQVLFAGIISVAVFGDPLHPAMVAGTLILILSGLYIWWREVRAR